MLGLELVRQLRHPGTCVHMELVGPADTIVRITVSGETQIISLTSAYRWCGRVVVCRIVIECVDVWWILHFALHNCVSHWLRDVLSTDAFVVVACHIMVLTYDTHS